MEAEVFLRYFFLKLIIDDSDQEPFIISLFYKNNWPVSV